MCGGNAGTRAAERKRRGSSGEDLAFHGAPFDGDVPSKARAAEKPLKSA
jgi:hypothetical protein